MYKIGKPFFPLLLLVVFFSKSMVAANFSAGDSNKPAKKDSAKKPAKSVMYQPAPDNSNEQTLVIHPIVRLGVGMLSYIGNVKINSGTTNIQSPASGRVGYDMGLTQKLSPVTEFSLNFLYGNLAETQITTTANWNFQSTIAGGGINLLFKILPKQDLTPYVIIGVESYEFFSRADVYDQYGNQYYSWSDGTMRSIPQGASNQASAKILNNDYSYETDVRSLNLDGSGKYNQQTFAVPVGIGFMMKVGTRADFMIGTTLHYTFTDHIDGLTPQVSGPLKGTLSNDMFMFSYITLRFNLTRDHPKTHRFENAQFDLSDTVHPYVAGQFDTTDNTLQHQYELYMDSTGEYGQRQVDPFHWHRATPIAEQTTSTPGAKTSKNGNGTKSDNSNGGNKVATTVTPTNNGGNNGNPGDVVYKVQLLATYIPLAEGITFAGINDKASVDVDKGMYRYTTGNFNNFTAAVKYLNQLKAIGYTDAFIRATSNGKNVPLNSGNLTANGNNAAASNGTPRTGSAAAIAQAVGSGLVYKIQLGVFGTAAPDQNFMSTLNQFKDLKIVKDNAGLSHYMVGSYTSFKDADAARAQAKASGIKDVCVMAFNNGHYISNAQAQGMEKK